MIFRLSSVRLRPLSGACLTLLMLACGSGLAPGASRARSLFEATEVDQNRFVLVAAPIGSRGSRFQLNIYEQIRDLRPCFAVTPGVPAAVDPLLARFDFSGICSRYIDANGYSLRIGNTDLAASYRLTVRTDPAGTVLVASPTRQGAGPELLLARSGGAIQGFHRLQPEPGWRLMRRTFGTRQLGHLYLYSDAWPMAATAPAPAPSGPQPAPAAPAAAPGAAMAPAAGMAVPPAAASPAPGPAAPRGRGGPAAGSLSPISGGKASPPAAPPNL